MGSITCDVNELTTVLLEWYTTGVFDDIERLGTTTSLGMEWEALHDVNELTTVLLECYKYLVGTLVLESCNKIMVQIYSKMFPGGKLKKLHAVGAMSSSLDSMSKAESNVPVLWCKISLLFRKLCLQMPADRARRGEYLSSSSVKDAALSSSNSSCTGGT